MSNRLPRRYSDHRLCTHSRLLRLGPAPLCGHANILHALLRGAHADRTDKRGVTLEMLARENGMEATVKVLREWVFNKDLDSKERKRSGSGSKGEGGAEGGGGKDKKACGTAVSECLKRSVVTCRTVDRARLNTFKSQSHSDTSTYTLGLGDTNTKR